MNATIKTYHSSLPVKPNTFFLQSRGLHSGRPLLTPIANCFSIELSSKEEFDFYFSLIEALFLNKAFSLYIIGSVVPMIRISDVKKVITEGHTQVTAPNSNFEKIVSINAVIDKQISALSQKLTLLEQLKSAYLQELFKRG